MRVEVKSGDSPYTIATFGTKKNNFSSETVLQTNESVINKDRTKNRYVVESYAVPVPNEELCVAEQFAIDNIISSHKEYGISISKFDIPDIRFIPTSSVPKMQRELGYSYPYRPRAVWDPASGSALVFYQEGALSNLDWSEIIFEELFHSTGIAVAATNGQEFFYPRGGFGIEKYVTLEESLASYEAKQFGEKLGKLPEFKTDYMERGRRRKNVIRKNPTGLISPLGDEYEGTAIELEFCRFLINKGDDLLEISPNAYAASLMKHVLEKYDESERGELFGLLYNSRRDLKKIPLLASNLAQKLGPNSYNIILKTPYTCKDIYSTIELFQAN